MAFKIKTTLCICMSAMILINSVALATTNPEPVVTKKGIKHSIDAAYLTAQSLQDQKVLIDQLIKVSSKFIEIGEDKKALAIAKELKEKHIVHGYIRVLSEILITHAQLGQFNEIKNILDDINGSNEKNIALANLIYVLIDMNELSVAKYVANRVTNPLKQNELYSDLAQAYIANSLINAAIDTALLINRPVEKSAAIKRIIEKLAMINETDRGFSLLNNISIPKIKYQALCDLIEGLCIQKQFQRAQDIADTIEDPTFKDQAWGRIAGQYAQNYQLERAFDILNTLPSGLGKDFAISGISKSQASSGYINHASNTAANIINQSILKSTLLNITPYLILEGNFEDAMRLLDTITDQNLRSKAQIALAAQMGTNQRSLFALLLIKQLRDPHVRSEALKAYALSFSEFENAQKQAKIISDIEDFRIQMDALEEILELYLFEGKFNLAEQTALQLTNPTTQIYGLIRVSQAYKGISNRALALELLSIAQNNASDVTPTSSEYEISCQIAEQFMGLGDTLSSSKILDRIDTWLVTENNIYDHKNLLKCYVLSLGLARQYQKALHIIAGAPNREYQTDLLIELPMPDPKVNSTVYRDYIKLLKEIAPEICVI